MRDRNGRFLKGMSGNYKGRPPISKELALAYGASKLHPASYIEIINKYLFMSVLELEELKKDKSINAIDYALVSVLLDIINNGDMSRLECLLNRVVGKPSQQIEVQTYTDSMSDKWRDIPKEQKLAVVRELKEELRCNIETARRLKKEGIKG